MTGWYKSGETNPLSRVTIASMADLGYEVNMAAADSYTRPTTSSTTASAMRSGSIAYAPYGSSINRNRSRAIDQVLQRPVAELLYL